jgi:hypothetical protein
VADVAGGDWPERSRSACVEICTHRSARGQSLEVRLLVDLRLIFDHCGSDPLGTDAILDRLTGHTPFGVDADGESVFLSESPWADLRGSPLDARGLASFLRRYDIRPTKVRRRQHAQRQRITSDAVDAFLAREFITLHRALGLRPWEASPIDAGEPCVYPAGSAYAESFDRAVELRNELQRACKKNRTRATDVR